MLAERERTLRWVLRDIERFSRFVLGRPLRPYQLEPARAILRSVFGRRGLTFTVVCSRQAGKNELSAHLEAYLLVLFEHGGGQIVKAAPTLEPQGLVSRRRLEALLDNPLTRGRYRRAAGQRIELGRAGAVFLSAAPEASIVGQTASLLLEVDEAQDVEPDKYDRDLRPMGASANVTTVLYGTAWRSDALLEREKRRNLELAAQDGVRRHFEYPWTAVAAWSPEYGRYVAAERDRLGADHPLFVTQYELRPLEGGGGLFADRHLVLLEGEHRRQARPEPGVDYVAGVDIAGESEVDVDERLRRLQPRKDSTAVVIAALRWQEVGGAVLEPRLEVVELVRWTGHSYADQTAQLLGLLRDLWRVRRMAVDATGAGAGVASFLVAALGEQVVDAVRYDGPTKSRLGYDLVAAVGAGRVRLYTDRTAERAELFQEAARAVYEMVGNQLMRWEVPASEGHDDYLNALALAVRAAGLVPYRQAVGRGAHGSWRRGTRLSDPGPGGGRAQRSGGP